MAEKNGYKVMISHFQDRAFEKEYQKIFGVDELRKFRAGLQELLDKSTVQAVDKLPFDSILQNFLSAKTVEITVREIPEERAKANLFPLLEEMKKTFKKNSKS